MWMISMTLNIAYDISWWETFWKYVKPIEKDICRFFSNVKVLISLQIKGV